MKVQQTLNNTQIKNIINYHWEICKVEKKLVSHAKSVFNGSNKNTKLSSKKVGKKMMKILT